MLRDSTIRNCCRCYSNGDMYEMETVKTRRGMEIQTMYFHPDCYDKYVYGKLAYERGVSGVEYDMAGNRINIEKVLSRSNSETNKTALVGSLLSTLASMKDPGAWIDANLSSFAKK